MDAPPSCRMSVWNDWPEQGLLAVGPLQPVWFNGLIKLGAGALMTTMHGDQRHLESSVQIEPSSERYLLFARRAAIRGVARRHAAFDKIVALRHVYHLPPPSPREHNRGSVACAGASISIFPLRTALQMIAYSCARSVYSASYAPQRSVQHGVLCKAGMKSL